MDAATRLIVMCCFLLTGDSLTRASADNRGGRRSHGDEPNKARVIQINKKKTVVKATRTRFVRRVIRPERHSIGTNYNNDSLKVTKKSHKRNIHPLAALATTITPCEAGHGLTGSTCAIFDYIIIFLSLFSVIDGGDRCLCSGLFYFVTNAAMNVTMETCLDGRSCLGAQKLCNVSTLRCQCRPGYSTSQRDPTVCVPAENVLRMGQGQGEPCNSSIPCSEARAECNKPGQCLCALGTVWRDGSCAEDKFRLVSWLIWVAASAAVIAAILVAAKVTALILRKRNYRRGNLLSATDDSAVSEEDGNDGGDHIQVRLPDHPDHQSASTS
ncbi:unnamed protein product [Ixodes pacificus]